MIVQPHKLTKTSRNGFIALGSNRNYGNLGPIGLLQKVFSLLEAESIYCEVQSSWYGSEAYPAGSGPDFVNAVAGFSTDLPPVDLLAALHRVEQTLGRERTQRWGARTCDLDLLAYEDLVLPDLETYHHWNRLDIGPQQQQTPEQLILPHPRLADRAFVLVPLCEISPDWVHPVNGLTAKALLARLPADLQQSVWKL